MIRIALGKMKKSGGPGIFCSRLLTYMQEHEMIKIVDASRRPRPDIYFTTIWLGSPPRKTRIVYRAASAYYNTHEKKRNNSLNFKLRKAMRAAHYVIYQSAFSRKLTKNLLLYKARRYKIIRNGFDKKPYKKIKSYKRREGEENLFIASSDWTEGVKRGRLVVDSFLAAKIHNSKLIMIGKKPRKRRKHRKVVYTGKLPMDQIVSYLKSKPVFIHFSYLEVCPNVVVEALSYGCPIVCNNIGGTPELVQEDGIIADCDYRFAFKRYPVELHNVKPGATVSAIKKSITIDWNIKREDLSMDICAKQYLQAFQECLAL